jgi:hypothetical protein
LICLLASTSTTTVAAGEWGNLANGDTMTWDTETTEVWEEGTSTSEWTMQMEILRIGDGSLTVELAVSFNGGSASPSTVTRDNFLPFIAKQSDLAGYSTVTYNFEGTGHEAAYVKLREMEDSEEWSLELWWDTVLVSFLNIKEVIIRERV